MPKIKIKILKEDILLNNYEDSEECPITKALARAGHPKLKDGGLILGTYEGKSLFIKFLENSSYTKLLEKLFGMYNTINPEDLYDLRDKNNECYYPKPIPVKDFTHTISW